MKNRIIISTIFMAAVTAFAAETNSTSAEVEANYTKAIEGRTAEILKILALSDTDKATNVHDSIIAQYRSLNAWHEANDAKLRASRSDTNTVAQIRVSLKAIHDEFLSKLGKQLEPEQVEQVKDKMTYGKVQFTFNGYVSQYPDLSDTNKRKILEMLKEAREEAMDGGSAEEKTAVFQRYKGKINNYLSREGIHPEKKGKALQPDTNSPAK